MIHRSLVVGLIAVSVAFAAAGCGGADEEPQQEQTRDGGAADLSGQRATIATFGGLFDKAIKAGYVDPASEATGLEVVFDSPTDYAKLQAQVESGNVSWDVAVADPWWSLKECGRLLEPVPNELRREVDDQYVIDDCAVPADVFAFQFMYDDERFGDNPPSSWADFFDVDTYPGKRAIWGSYVVNGLLEAALIADGVAPDDLYPLDLDRAIRKLDSIREHIVFYDTLAQVEEIMISKNATLVAAVNDSGFPADENGATFSPVWNEAIISWNAYVVPKGANREAALSILEQVGSPEGQTKAVSVVPVGATARDIEPELEALLAKWSPANPENAANLIPLGQEYWSRTFDEANERWTAWVSG